jgi:F0F1-type ATP synthase epsilon subunit
MQKELLSVEVYFSIFMDKSNFSGKAVSVSSKNEVGNFDILPQHSNFITVIKDFLTIKTPKDKEIDYDFDKGVLKVSNNKVEIFLGL